MYADKKIGIEKEQTTIQSLNRLCEEQHSRLQALCNRLESFADRLEPEPKPAGDGPGKPPIQNDLQGMRTRINGFGESLDWLDSICNRLDRIA